MIIADKILSLRKKNNLSQEELAEKLGVSRQSVSKWESAASVPDINKIMAMSKLFGVSTDYLLKDEMEKLEYTEEDEVQGKMVLLEEAKNFVKDSKLKALINALGIASFILAAMPLILLSTLAEEGMFLPKNIADAIGLAFVLIMVAVGVTLCMVCGNRLKAYNYIKQGDFELGFGVSGIIKEYQKNFEPKRHKASMISTIMFVLATAPLMIASNFEISEIWEILLLIFAVAMVAFGVIIITLTAGEKNAYNNLLSKDDYSLKGRIKRKKEDKIDNVYWPIVTAIYLGWSFWSSNWHITWVIWPVAALLNSAIVALIVGEAE